MVAAAPKRGTQATLWDDDGEHSGTGAAVPAPARHARRRKRPARGQLTLDFDAPDPLAWLDAHPAPVPHEEAEALGADFVAALEALQREGRAFRDKDGWQSVAGWVARNEMGLWRAANTVAAKCDRWEAGDAFGELAVLLVGYAKWIKPSGNKMLTCIMGYGVRKLLSTRPGGEPEGAGWDDESMPEPGTEVDRRAGDAYDATEYAIQFMRADEARAVRLRFIDGLKVPAVAKRLKVTQKQAAWLIRCGLNRARAALVPKGED